MASSFGAELGKIIREARESRALTQRDLAISSFGDESYARRISELENGRIRRPRAKTYHPICDALGIDGRVIAEIRSSVDDTEAQVKSEIRELTGERGSIDSALTEITSLRRDQLELLATRFLVEKPFDLSESDLLRLLTEKADDFRKLTEQLDAAASENNQLEELRNSAQDALERADFEEAENILSETNQLEVDALSRTQELRALNALLRGRVEQAFELFETILANQLTVSQSSAIEKSMAFGKTLFDHSLRYGGKGLELAERLWEKFIDQSEIEPHSRAAALSNIGASLRNRGVRAEGKLREELLSRSVSKLRTALSGLSVSDRPSEWAVVQNNLGTALQDQYVHTGGSSGAQNLTKAIQAYKAALEIRTKSDYPIDWATTQNNLGAALMEQSTRVDGNAGADLINGAVSAFRSALQVRIREDFPDEWAMTQTNLGTALSELGSRTGGARGKEHILDAVQAYRSALEVRTRQDRPLDWSATQTNLANSLLSLSKLSEGSERSRLESQASAVLKEIDPEQSEIVSRNGASRATRMNLQDAIFEQTDGAIEHELELEPRNATQPASTSEDAHQPISWSTDEKLNTICESLSDFVSSLDFTEARVITFETLLDVTEKNVIDTELIGSLNLLVASRQAILEFKAVFLSTDGSEFELPANDIENAIRFDRIIHPSTGKLVEGVRGHVRPYFSRIRVGTEAA